VRGDGTPHEILQQYLPSDQFAQASMALAARTKRDADGMANQQAA
jgi:hypothetical protein